MKYLIAGGSGTLGRRIAAYLATGGDEVAVLTRSPRGSFPFRQVEWDGRTEEGGIAASGTYFLRLQTASKEEVRRLVVRKGGG